MRLYIDVGHDVEIRISRNANSIKRLPLWLNKGQTICPRNPPPPKCRLIAHRLRANPLLHPSLSQTYFGEVNM